MVTRTIPRSAAANCRRIGINYNKLFDRYHNKEMGRLKKKEFNTRHQHQNLSRRQHLPRL